MKHALSFVLIGLMLCVVGCSKKEEGVPGAGGATVVAPSVDAKAAAPTKYPAEVQVVVDRMTAMLNDSAARIEKATSEQEVAAALQIYSTQMKSLVEESRVLRAKYPNLEELSKDDGGKADEAVERATERFAQAMVGVVQKYPQSSVIMKAFEQLGAMEQE